MAEMRIDALPRDPQTTTGIALRRSGYVPGVYYNREGVVRCLQFERNALNALLRKEVGLLHVDLNGEDLACIIREVQRHPVRRDIVHIDLMGIVKGQKIRAHVPIHPVGTAAGIKEGGTLELVLRDVEVECEPANLPTHIDIDVTRLKIYDSVKLADIRLEGVVVHGEPTATVVHVIPPRTAEAEAAAGSVSTETKEPEVIREKKVEEDK